MPSPHLHHTVLVGERALPVPFVTLPLALVFRPVVIIHDPMALLTVVYPRAVIPIAIRIEHHALSIEVAVVEFADIHGTVLPNQSTSTVLLVVPEVAFEYSRVFIDIGTSALFCLGAWLPLAKVHVAVFFEA